MTTTEELIGLLPLALQADADARHALEGMLNPVARVNSLLARKAERLAELLDPSEVPDELVVHLAGLVGVGVDLPAAARASTEDRRKLVAVAVAFWKRKGTATSWRDLVSTLAGSRSILLDWFYTRTVIGSYGERHTIPAPGTGSALYYSHPERVSDLWYQDPAGAVDRDLLARFLGVARASSERINLIAADLVDDFGAGPGQWTWNAAGAWSHDADAWELHADDGAEFTPELDGLEAAWASYHAFLRFAVTGGGVIRVRYTATDHYRVEIDQAAGSVTLVRVIAGVPVVLATAVQRLGEAFPYRWSVEAWEGASSTTLRVYLEAVKLIDVVDTTVGRPAAGPIRWGSTSTGDRATCSTLIVWPAGTSPTRIGPTP